MSIYRAVGDYTEAENQFKKFLSSRDTIHTLHYWDSWAAKVNLASLRINNTFYFLLSLFSLFFFDILATHNVEHRKNILQNVLVHFTSRTDVTHVIHATALKIMGDLHVECGIYPPPPSIPPPLPPSHSLPLPPQPPPPSHSFISHFKIC